MTERKKYEIEKIYERIYDNPSNDNGTKKPNKLLGKFKIIDGGTGGYSFVCYGINSNNEIFKITGVETSFLRDKYNAGTRIFLEKLSDSQDIQVYKKYAEYLQVRKEKEKPKKQQYIFVARDKWDMYWLSNKRLKEITKGSFSPQMRSWFITSSKNHLNTKLKKGEQVKIELGEVVRV